jgi:hypothetical protein
MSDVQRAIALILVGTLAIITLATAVKLMFSADPAVIADVSKTLQAALVNMALIALGFFFGSNLSKQQADAGQQRIVDKLTSTNPPGTPGPIAPVPAPTVPPTPWWTVLTDDERTNIDRESTADPAVAKFAAAAQLGRATQDDLVYLVSKNLLTADRARIIGATP